MTATSPATPARLLVLGELPRYLHPLAWWGWALGLLVAASRTTNLLLLGLILAVVWFVASARRPDAPWAGAFPLALRLGLFVLFSRMILQMLFSAPAGTHVVFALPVLALPDWLAGVRIGGLVTWESLLIGLADGARLAVMLACVGAANSLASPSRLLRSMPAALYEVGVAVVVALSLAPNLITGAGRVRAARRLRGHQEGRLRGFTRSAGPVFEGALEHSIQLAAAMDSRGYGRTGRVSPQARRLSTVLVLTGCAGVLVGLYGLFDTAAPRLLGWPLLGLGIVSAGVGLGAAGRRSIRTSYRADPWVFSEWLTVGSGVAVAVLFLLADPAVLALPTQLRWPTLPMAAALACLIGLLPGLLTPTPPRGAQ